MDCTVTSKRSAARTLYELTDLELATTDRRYPKWATLCRLRLLGLPVLNGILITPTEGSSATEIAIRALADATQQQRLLLRSDGGIESHQYYRGGNTFPIDQLLPRACALLDQGRAVILLEPTNRFTNELAAQLRMDRPGRGQPGQFTIEALGPGYDNADLARAGISPQVTVSATDVDWSCYREIWWSDLRLVRNQSPATESERRQRRLAGLATYALADTGDLLNEVESDDRVAAAEAWLRAHRYLKLWQSQDVEDVIARHARRWFDDAFMIARFHPNRSWTCLSTSISDLGSGRWIFWDVVDGANKYGTGRSE